MFTCASQNHNLTDARKMSKILTDWRALSCALGLILISGCVPARVERAPDPEPTPTPGPPATPHPAAAAQERAVQLYPDLAVKSSLFNRTFLELVQQTQANNPRELAQVDWPIVLAHQTGRMLGISPLDGSKVTPTPAPASPVAIIPATPKFGSSLDQGAYNQKHSPQKSAGTAPTPSMH